MHLRRQRNNYSLGFHAKEDCRHLVSWLLHENGSLCLFDWDCRSFDDGAHDSTERVKGSLGKIAIDVGKEWQLLQKGMLSIQFSSLLDHRLHYFPHELWQLLHYNELQEPPGC